MTEFPVEDPATGETIAMVMDGGPAEATAAVDAAAAAARAWAGTPARTRSELLHRTFELMLRDREELAALIVRENGKPLADARGEVTYAAEFFRWYGEEAVRADGAYGPSPAGGTRTVVTRRPVGVAALVTPWNFPAAMATRKIGPALAAGCTVVLKPAAETPLTALAIARLLAEAGVPDGVVNLVTTTDAGSVVTTWLEDPRVRKISFTGSTRVGRLLLRQAADRVVNASMELGGNAPFVVTADADLDAAVDGAMIAKFRNGGQACTAANRFYVHADVAEDFLARLGKRVEALNVGPSGDVGPLISAKAVDGVTKLVDSALAAGARVVARAEIPSDGKGYFFAPVVLADVPPDADVVQEEIFGPVAPVVTWRDEEELLTQVNATEMGLAAYVYAGNLQDALRLGEATDAGMVGINRGLVSDPSAPFGGLKQSGLGREGAREGLHEFTEIQYLSVDWP
ncbi:NAD-dependent succinate-semialdehyde dehydrogenase [Amycolatopsis alkalitolerans]|uniref:NAD-dependent succinate-semialdehyde dehydrogenase n=1 Tax=Amycolatopsis alkalitolerans TaxID=2547244 RepID=A0A5C4LXB1_9PSEU|nr:NAD-dependent succinate-semialdehyde dehydrogenase [Amycolatopsis alkalitolerans]TNC23443.1 NAD-dependent succinate-semialdehyde dehydrogenase [Amycolatopsis alkalitolerans]